MRYGLEFIAPIQGDTPKSGRKPALTVRFDPTGTVQSWKDIVSQRALVDTGADYCLFDQKGVDLSKCQVFPNLEVDAVQTGAGTKRKTNIYKMSILLPNDETILTIPFIPIDMDTDLPYKIILGMDFIRHGVLNIDKGSRNGYFDFDSVLV